MEKMFGSLDRVIKLVQLRQQTLPEEVLGKIAVEVSLSLSLSSFLYLPVSLYLCLYLPLSSSHHCAQVLKGLIYLKKKINVMHRGLHSLHHACGVIAGQMSSPPTFSWAWTGRSSCATSASARRWSR
jgi:hypothetical protein